MSSTATEVTSISYGAAVPGEVVQDWGIPRQERGLQQSVEQGCFNTLNGMPNKSNDSSQNDPTQQMAKTIEFLKAKVSHFQRLLLDNHIQKTPVTNSKKHPCRVIDCGKAFNRLDHLNKHIRQCDDAVHKTLAILIDEAYCVACNMSFGRATDLVRHEKLAHHELYRSRLDKILDEDPVDIRAPQGSLTPPLSPLSTSISVGPGSDDELSSEIENMSKSGDSRAFSQAKAHPFKAAAQDSQSLSYDRAGDTPAGAAFWPSSKRAFMAAPYESQTLPHSNVVVSHQTGDASSEVDFGPSPQRPFMAAPYEFQTLPNSSVPELHQAGDASTGAAFWPSQRAFMAAPYESQTLLPSNIAGLQQASDASTGAAFWPSQRVFMAAPYESQTLLPSNIAGFQQASDASTGAALWPLTQRPFIAAPCTPQIPPHDHFHYPHQASDVSMGAPFLTVNTAFSRGRAR